MLDNLRASAEYARADIESWTEENYFYAQKQEFLTVLDEVQHVLK